MTTSFVHIGDTHLQASHPRNDARLQALDQIIDEGLALPDLGAWLWPGDIFHARSAIADRNHLADRLQRMADAAPVCIAVGNHEAAEDVALFGRLASRFPIHVSTAPEVVHVYCATGDAAAIALLPFPQKGGVIAGGTTAAETLNIAHQALEDVFRGLAADLDEGRRAGELPLFIGHITISGSRTCVGQPVIGVEIEADRAMLDLLGDCYKGLSHIHEPQVIAGAHYAGSIAPMDWGEVTPRSYIVVQYQRDGDAWEYRVGRRPIDTPRLYHVEGQWTCDGFFWQCEAGGEVHPAPESWVGTEVRCRYRFPASERSIVNEDAIRTLFSAASRLELEPVAIPDRGLRAPEVAAAHTLSEKLAAWCRFGGFDAPSEALLEKLALLEQQDAQAVLSAVANQVAALENGQKDQVAA